MLGRMRGPRFRAGRLYERVGHRIERLAARLGPAELIASRFVYGTKAASMVFWGLHGMSVVRFAAGRRGGVRPGLAGLHAGSGTW